MKNLSLSLNTLLLFLTTMIIISLTSCKQEQKKDFDSYGDVLKKEHKIRKMVDYMSTEGHLSGGFFIFAGNLRGQVKESMRVTFSWECQYKEHPNNLFITSTFDVTDIIIVLDSNVKEPNVKFVCSGFYINEEFELNTNRIAWAIKYPIITCHPDDWKIDVQIPLEQKE